MSTTRLTAPDGTPIYAPGAVDLSDDDVERLRRDGAVVDAGDGSIDITWAFWKPQRTARAAVYSGDHDLVGFVAGFRSGKSVTGARVSIEVALRNDFAPARVLAMGKTYAEAKKTTYPVLFEELPGNNLDPFLGDGDPTNSPIVRSWTKQDGVITLINGSVIILASADKPNRYDGGKFSFAWLDEAAYYDHLNGIRKTVGERLDYKPVGPRCILVTTTGNGFNDAFDLLERNVDPADDSPLGIRTTLITASTSNNPFLTPDDRDRLSRVHGGTGREGQALHGSFEATEGRVYSAFRRHSHVVDVDPDGSIPAYDTAIDGDWRIYGFDAGWDNPRVLLEVAKTHAGQYVVVDEFYRSESHVEDLVGGPNHDTYWLEGKPKGRIHAEHEPGDIQKMRRRGWKAGKAEKSVDAGIDEVRYRLREDHHGRPGLLVASRCESTIKELLGYTEDDVGGSDVDDHAVDALRYCIYTESVRSSSGSGGSSTVDTA
jgi:hypothetical protein